MHDCGWLLPMPVRKPNNGMTRLFYELHILLHQQHRQEKASVGKTVATRTWLDADFELLFSVSSGSAHCCSTGCLPRTSLLPLPHAKTRGQVFGMKPVECFLSGGCHQIFHERTNISEFNKFCILISCCFSYKNHYGKYLVQINIPIFHILAISKICFSRMLFYAGNKHTK